MAEATINEFEVAHLMRSSGQAGFKLVAFHITVSEGETLTTGLSKIFGLGTTEVEGTDVDGNTNLIFVDAISAGTITWLTGAIGAYGDATDMEVYGLIMGSGRGI